MPMDTDRHDTPRTAADGRRPNLTAQTASGLRWSYVGTAALMVANLAYTAIISRLLGPVAFGLMALANLVVLFAQYFVRMGIASALVQRPTLSRDEVRAASTAGLAFGAFCFGGVWPSPARACGASWPRRWSPTPPRPSGSTPCSATRCGRQPAWSRTARSAATGCASRAPT